MNKTIPQLPPKSGTSVQGAGPKVGPVKIFLFLMAFPAVPAIIYFVWTTAVASVTPLGLLGAPVHVAGNDGDRIYYLTGQWRTIFTTTGRHVYSRSSTTHLFVDLWAFDAAETRPLWRKRLETERNGAMTARSILGVQGDTLWLLLKGQPAAVSATTGEPLLKTGELESRNPALKGLLPTEDRYYEFDTHGLRFTGADGRTWRVKEDLSAGVETTLPEVPGTAHPPDYFTPYATHIFQVRSLDIPGGWLGLLNDDEVTSFDETNSIGGLNWEGRYRLWHATSSTEPALFGDYLLYNNFKPLAGNPEFLAGGLITAYASGAENQAIWLTDPDSVLVLHRERLGHGGHLRLTRVAGPEGKVIWECTLPLTILQSVMRGEKSLTLFGKEYFPPPPGSPPDDPTRDAPERLVSVDLTTGALHTFIHEAVDSHPEPQPITLAP